MTDEEMGAYLLSKGWRVKPPLTQETCDHPVDMRYGSGMVGCDGSSKSDIFCRKCGKSWKYEIPANRPVIQPYQRLNFGQELP
jgi:hypothetical protein